MLPLKRFLALSLLILSVPVILSACAAKQEMQAPPPALVIVEKLKTDTIADY